MTQETTEVLRTPQITVALALAAGMISQSLARHMRLPGIVILLAVGMLLGPDFAGVVNPDGLGHALEIIVGFSVAVILFEGGMQLSVKRIRAQAQVIRRLLTVGALVTATGGAVASHYLMGWGWRVSILFGTLVIVTGPTVITPLLRRIKVHHKVGTILEAEGVLIDAVGAVVAVVTLEVTLGFTGENLADGFVSGLARLGFGLVCGLVGGYAIALLLRVENLVPEGLQNVFTLSLVLALFQLSNAVVPESGVMSVTAAGIVVGNVRTRVHRDLLEFKEQLTVLFIGMLFVLLAADVRLGELRSLGWGGVLTVLALMLIVRPLNVAISSWGSDLKMRERLFLSWLAPRGVVAAAIAALFAQTLAEATRDGDPLGIWGGSEQLQALVFLVIAGTVLLQGLSGGQIARLLGLRRPANRGYAILGANELGHALGRILRDAGEEVMFIDSNPAACHVVEQDGFKVIFGNVMLERTMFRARIEDRAAICAVTPNEEANLLFARQASTEFKVPRLYVALADGSANKRALAHREGARVLFGGPRDLELWALRMRRKTARVETWRFEGPAETSSGGGPFEFTKTRLLPIVAGRGKRIFPVNERDGLKTGDLVHFAIFDDARDEAVQELRARGWRATDTAEAAAVQPSPGVTA